MFYSLPPAGNPVLFKKDDQADDFLSALFSPYQAFYFNSGAASLAISVKAMMNEKRNPQGEVLLPAYACPELVSAIQYAGAKPVLVDLEENSPRIDLDCLRAQITENTVAIIAVSLFGIPERIDEIAELVKARDIYLIEDNAQHFLSEGGVCQSKSDVIIFSFGRGKPVSILTGGAALVKSPSLVRRIRLLSSVLPETVPGKLKLKVFIYNMMISPLLYWLPESLPFLGLGQTVYRPLAAPMILSAPERSLIPINIKRFWLRSDQPQQWINEVLSSCDVLVDVAAAVHKGELPRLIRYPILAPSVEIRNVLVEQLKTKGLGVSCMYPLPLNRIDGLTACFKDSGNTPNAENFSSRLFTLPVHSGVRKKDVDNMAEVLRTFC